MICCVKHKSEYRCDGRRERCAYLSIGKFTDVDLVSDYHFLEDVLKCGDRAGRIVRDDMGDGDRRGRPPPPPKAKRRRIDHEERGQEKGAAAAAAAEDCDGGGGEGKGGEPTMISPLLRLSLGTDEPLSSPAEGGGRRSGSNSGQRSVGGRAATVRSQPQKAGI